MLKITHILPSLRWLCSFSYSSLLILTFLLVCTHLFQTLRVSHSDIVSLHVIDPSIRVHQVLVVLALDLNHAHHHTIDHVNRLAFVLLAFCSFFIVLDSFSKLVHVVLNSLATIIVIDAILNRGTALIHAIIDPTKVVLMHHPVKAVLLLLLVADVLSARLEFHIVKGVLTAAVIDVVLRVHVMDHALVVVLIGAVIFVVGLLVQVC